MFVMSVFMIFFFFSSRRRHTRLQGDWSSDVCSSNLARQWQRRLDHRLSAHRERRLGRVRARSEERRVGKECRSRWWADHLKKKEKRIKEIGYKRKHTENKNVIRGTEVRK